MAGPRTPKPDAGPPASRSASLVPDQAPAGIRIWLMAARPRTLPASVVPVVVGTAAAGAVGHAVWWRALLAAVVAVALQVGTNYANDYSDGIRGTDEKRVGPVRLVASGLASPAAVRRALRNLRR